MSGEFDLIRKYFRTATPSRGDVITGIGDDCALLRVPPAQELAVSMDTLVCGRHFAEDVDPESLGHKALAVNLSDLAAMGAEPAWVTLGLTLPRVDETWLSDFMRGFSALAARHQVQLIGGDTTRGPLSVTIQAHGLVPRGDALFRGGAGAGDLVYVSGTLGDAGLALRAQQGLCLPAKVFEAVKQRLDRPVPRVGLGLALRAYASAAIDLSDGLGRDLGHICEQSGLGITLLLERLPLSDAVRDYVQATDDWSLPLSSGDDYELAFTLPAGRQAGFESLARQFDVAVTRVGVVGPGKRVRAIHPDGHDIDQATAGYDHFNV